MAMSCASVDSPAQQQPDNVWTQSSHAEFAKGRFGDAGANTYVSARGRIQVVNRWDLNTDGEIDLVFANSHPQAEKLDSVIYWGNGKDFSDKNRSFVPNEGSQNCAAADLNGDGKTDLVVANYANGTWSKMPSFVYYGAGGTASGLGKPWDVKPFAQKTVLPTEAAQAAAIGDLNKDGHPDIVFAQSAGFWEYRGQANALASPSRIYWGSKEGYSPEKFLDVEASGASDAEIADLDKDGWTDLVIANRERAGKWDVTSFVYYGSESGFSPERRTELPTNQANAVTVADVNGDGAPDILFANGVGRMSYIYLSQSGRFDPSRRVELPTSDARDCEVADLNNDGAADVFFTNNQTAQNPLTVSTIYWGSPGGFSPDKKQDLETVGAWGCSLADLNGDKLIDIVVSNFQEYHSYDICSYIYWNSPKGFSQNLRTSLFTHGAVGNTVADFNGDGHLDVLFNNTMNRRRGGVTPSFVYWGNSKGQFSVQNRLDLPGVEPYDWAAGDLDDDGRVDLIFANMAEIGRRNTESFLFWGTGDSSNPFTVENRTALVVQGARGATLGDLDRDGYLDLVMFAMPTLAPGPPTQGLVPPGGVLIYWGSPDGFITPQRTSLPGSGNGLPQVADLNRDGHLDIIVPGGLEPTLVYHGDGTRNYSSDRRIEIPGSRTFSNSEVADINRDGILDLILTFRGHKPSYIYFGDASGQFSESRRTPFTPIETQGVTVGDLNKDGWLDIVGPSYKNGGTRATMSRIWLGGPQGISDERMIELPSFAGTGSQIHDYNHDGFNDLMMINHRAEGDPDKVGRFSDHCTDTYIYWGAADGLRADRKLHIPTEGAHYDGGVDLGNIYDRSPRFDYISVAHEYGSRRGSRLDFKAQTPHGSRVVFQIRTAPSEKELESSEWTGPSGKDSYYERSGAAFTTPDGHSWIQYRAVLDTKDGVQSPSIESVSLIFK
jgi:hypothetical protein